MTKKILSICITTWAIAVIFSQAATFRASVASVPTTGFTETFPTDLWSNWAISVENMTDGTTLWTTPDTAGQSVAYLDGAGFAQGALEYDTDTFSGDSVFLRIYNAPIAGTPSQFIDSAPLVLSTDPNPPTDTFDYSSSTWTAAVPEPATMAMFSVVFGMLGVFWHRKRR